MRLKPSRAGGRRLRRLGVVLAAVALIGAAAAAGAVAGSKRSGAITPPPSANCQLANGIKHVIEITFDNVHFNRDNPNVLSDLEQMPRAARTSSRERHAAVEQPHAADRAHRRRHSHKLHRPLRRPPRPGDHEQLRDVQQSGRPTSRSRRSPTGPARYDLDPFPNMPYSATVPAAGSPAGDAAGAVGAVHAGRLRRRRRVDRQHGAREHQPRSAERVRAELAGGRSSTTPTLTRSRTRRQRLRRPRRALRARATRSAPTPRR